MQLRPKYDVGDTVFCAGHPAYEGYTEQCPDCLGSGVWKVETPAGDSFPCKCETCGVGSWTGAGSGRITKYKYSSWVRRLTIGSVRIDTADKNPISYMCNETGVGSGNVYYEEQLFDNEESAKVAGQIAAADAQRELDERAAKDAETLRKKEKRKPSPERRRIRELEARIKELTSAQS